MRKRLSAKIDFSLIPIQDMKQAIFFYMNSGQGGATTLWYNGAVPVAGFLNGTGSDFSDPAQNREADSWIFPCSGTMKNLYIYLSNGPGAAGTVTVTIFKNGVAQTLTIAQGASTSANPILLSDLVHSFNIVAGDLIGIQLVTGAANATGVYFTGAMEFDAS